VSPILVLLADSPEKRNIVLSITDIDGFVHAAPEDFVVYYDEEDRPQQVRKGDLQNFRVAT
jgi:hypothetical protein